MWAALFPWLHHWVVQACDVPCGIIMVHDIAYDGMTRQLVHPSRVSFIHGVAMMQAYWNDNEFFSFSGFSAFMVMMAILVELPNPNPNR